jgi:predicted permease
MNLNRMWRRYDRLLGADVASDINQELRFHIEAKAESLMVEGWAEDEARKEAERQFGDLGALQGEGERIGNRIERRKRLRQYWSDVLQDTRYGFRKLAKSPGFASFAILTLALGIGLCSVIFAFLNGALAPLPAVPEPERLAIMQAPIPYPWFKTYQGDGDGAWKAAAFMSPAPFNVSFEGEGSKRVTGILVSPEYFETLGVHPQLGRFFNTRSEREGSAPVVVVTERFWRTRLHSDPHAVGRRLRINGSVVPILGVCPRGFFGTGTGSLSVPDLFIPVTSNAAIAPELRDNVLHRNTQPAFWLLLRLKPGTTIATAEAQLDAETRHLQTRPQQKGKLACLMPDGTVMPLPPEARAVLYIFYGAMVLAVLGLICANLGGLMLARGAARFKEIAIRLSIGANRFRLVRQLVTESAVLAILGGFTGLATAILIFRLLRRVQADSNPLLDALISGPDFKVVLFTFAISGLVAIGFGLIPAVVVTGLGTADVMKAGLFNGLRGHRRFGIRNLFVVGQVMAAMTLVLIAGFIVIGAQTGSKIDPGFDSAPISFFSVDPTRDGLTGPECAEALRRIPERLARLGGVESVSLADGPPVSKSTPDTKVSVPSIGDRSVAFQRVGPNFLSTIGAAILRGTDFEDRTLLMDDGSGKVLPIAINQVAATDLFQSEDPLGRRIQVGEQAYQVAAVVRYLPRTILGSHAVPVVLAPLTASDLQRSDIEGTTVVIRAYTPAGIAAINSELAAIDPRITMFHPQTMQEYLSEQDRLASMITASYTPIGVFGLILACLGLAGVTAQTVQRRQKEIGIRIALGARRMDALRLVMGEGIAMVLSGAVLGFLVASGLARILAAISAPMAQVIGPAASDLGLTLGIPSFFVLLAAIACYVPARHAASINPLVALREE